MLQVITVNYNTSLIQYTMTYFDMMYMTCMYVSMICTVCIHFLCMTYFGIYFVNKCLSALHRTNTIVITVIVINVNKLSWHIEIPSELSTF